jgi:Tol biopolymer transport system component
MGGPARRIASAHIFEGLDWSPDGTWLAVSDFPQAPGAPPCDYISCPPAIHLVSVETGIAHQISFPPDTGRAVREDTDPVFSPDGTHVAFVRHNRGGGFQGIVHVQPIDGSREARQISRGRSAWDVDWTPDGRAIIVASGAPSNRRLLRYPLAGGEPDTLAVGTGALDVSVARKAGVLVYAEHYQNHDLWRVPGPAAATGAAPERLSGSTRDEFMPSHSPDGRRLAFISARSGDWEVWVSDADGRNELQLTSLGQALFPIWSPDGRAVFFSSTAPKIRAELSDVFVVDANGGRPRNLTEDEKLDAIPGLSLDGAWLYYQSNPGSTGWELWRKPIEGGDAERLTGSDALRPHAATDGRVYFSRAGLGIWSVPATGGDWRQVIAEPVVWNQWTIWRNTVVYLMHDDSTTTFRVHNVETGTDTVLHTIPAQTLRGAPSPGATLTLSVSPDGQWIVYSALDRMGSDLKIVNAIR